MLEIMLLYSGALGTVLIAVTLLWALSLPLRDASIIDIFWGTGFVLINLVTLILLESDPTGRQWLVHAMVTIWGLRLTLHLWVRNAGHGEDARYRRWRERGGPNWWLESYYRVFLLQGAIMLVVAAPVIVVNLPGEQAPLSWLDLLGVVVWLAGFLTETLADQQLVVFKRDPANRGRVLQQGIWRYTIHPNYFGDAMQWWGIWLVVVSAPWGFWTFFGPLAMTALFIFLTSGILERAMVKARPGYADYLSRTSRFFPLPPRRSREASG